MSVHGLKPRFKDRAGYRVWLSEWRTIYYHLSTTIRNDKSTLKRLHRDQPTVERTHKFHKELTYRRAMARKMMGVLLEAKARRDRIVAMIKSHADAQAQYPMTLVNCRHVDFYYNKGNIEFPMIPMWVVKAKGQTFYVHHCEAVVPWSTRETPLDAKTKGALRFRNCTLDIDKDGSAKIH